MADLLFNKAGVPLIGYGTRGALITTTGTPAIKPKTTEPKDPDQEKTSVANFYISDWGTGNKFPSEANDVINKVGVLNSGLKFIRNFTIGQGIYPVKVIGYDDKGNEILEMVNDPEINRFAKSRLVRRYMEKAVRDYMKFGCAFVQMIPNADGNKMAGLNTINALYARFAIADNNGSISKCVTSGLWPDTPANKEYNVYDVLDEYDPLEDLKRRKWANQIKNKSFIYSIKDSWSNNEYYSAPVWYSAYLSGWVDIALSVSNNLKAAIIKANRYEPDVNQVLEDFANHYNTTVTPARARKPQDYGSTLSITSTLLCKQTSYISFCHYTCLFSR